MSGSSPHTWGIRRARQAYIDQRRFIPTYVGHTWCFGFSFALPTVHPHIRGAYGPSQPIFRPPLGSSPHTWGIRQRKWMGLHTFRFIPTYVGHTSGRAESPANGPVHPHIRGAYGCEKVLSMRTSGSSPHTWGIHGILCERLPDSRFIPTYVGHTRCAKRRWPGGPVHPHIRGAYIPSAGAYHRPPGSSPHTWGIRYEVRGQEC